MKDFHCYHHGYNAQRLFDHYRSNPNNDYTIVVIYQIVKDGNWTVFEIGMDFQTELGSFKDIEHACMFADCFQSRDYMWYSGLDTKNIPWADYE